jgi:uncharacterized membrane protein YbhN (UPF0104 family)
MGIACVLGLAALPALPWLRKVLPAHPRLIQIMDCATLYLRDRRSLVMVTMLSLVVQLANVVLVWLIGEGMGLPVPPLYYGVLVPLVSILTLLPISLNGMGLREAGTVVLLSPLGVSSASAVTLSLLIFAVYTASSLSGGVFYLFGRSPRFVAADVNRASDGSLSASPSAEASPDADSLDSDSDQGRRRESTAVA